jgi:4-amino-4-deoxy-L-arabinose transferase-like glycosyltransferase
MMATTVWAYLRSRWLLLAILFVFIAAKLPHLSYPFYCDEAWVYAPAVKTMAINGPGLLPGVIPAGYSRGHPLLFHFLCALWIKCFGFSNVAVHLFPLLVSVVFLVILYEGCRHLFGSRIAVLSLLMLTTQVIFFVQASFVELEVMTAMFTFLSLYCYCTGRLFATSIALTLLFFTKESGLVFGAVIGLHALSSAITGKQKLPLRIRTILAVTVPVVLIAFFFVLQKATFGWYILPLHASLINTHWSDVYYSFRIALRCTFHNDITSSILAFFVVSVSVIPAVVKRDIRYLFLCLPIAVVCALGNKYVTDNTGDVIWIVLWLVCFSLPFYCLLLLYPALRGASRRFILLLGYSVAAYFCFLSFTAVTFRYVLVQIVLVNIFLAVCLDAFILAGGRALYYAAIAGILLIGVFAFYFDEGNDDTDLEAFHAMHVQKNVVAFLERENGYDKVISGGCWWGLVHFYDTSQGYLSSRRIFSKISWDAPGRKSDYVIFDNICRDSNYERIRKDTAFSLVYKTRENKTWAEVYHRNN